MGLAQVPVGQVVSEAWEQGLRASRELHRRHGSTYFLASRLFPRDVRDDVDALYGFVRTVDEWVDNPADGKPASALAKIESWRAGLDEGYCGRAVADPVLEAFAAMAVRRLIPPEEPALFLDAMASDATVREYATYEDLRGYMRGSAVAVGYMMCAVLGVPAEGDARQGASDLAEAMQLTNFLRDVGEDLERGRLYLPLEDLGRHGLTRADFERREPTPAVRAVLADGVERARRLYAASDTAIARLPATARRPVAVARELYSRILGRIEQNGYDVFTRRARTSRLEKGLAVARSFARMR